MICGLWRYIYHSYLYSHDKLEIARHQQVGTQSIGLLEPHADQGAHHRFLTPKYNGVPEFALKTMLGADTLAFCRSFGQDAIFLSRTPCKLMGASEPFFFWFFWE